MEPPATGTRKAKVLYDYDAHDASELSLLADEVWQDLQKHCVTVGNWMMLMMIAKSPESPQCTKLCRVGNILIPLSEKCLCPKQTTLADWGPPLSTQQFRLKVMARGVIGSLVPVNPDLIFHS